MTTPSEASVEAALAAMRARYVETSRGFITTLDLIGAQLAKTPDSDDLLTALRRELHRVSGTAGSIGFHEAGRMSSAMEALVRRWREEPSIDRDRRSAVVLGFSVVMAKALANGVAGESVPAVRHLLLHGVPPRLAERLVAEGVLRGFAVERDDEARTAELMQRTSSVWGVVAMDDESSGDVEAYDASSLVLLHQGADDTGTWRISAGNIVGVATEPCEIIDLLERVALQRGASAGTILLVDDDPMMIAVQRAVAEQDGFTVESAATGAEFRAALTRLDPALIVLDVQVPDADGIDLLREVRANVRHRGVPVLMLSGRSDVQTREAAVAAGADYYMVKPIVPSEFRQRVHQLLLLRRERRAATGRDPDNGLPLAARTMQDIEVRLASRDGLEWSVAIIRPAVDITPLERERWQAERLRIANVARDAGGIAGQLDDVSLAVALPGTPQAAAGTLEAAAAGRLDAAASWCAGVVGTSAVSLATPAALLGAATDAFLAARELGMTVREWVGSDTVFAPDVIIIEDDASLRELLEFALGARGLTHRSYSNGPDGLAALLELRVVGRAPIVLLDVDLPGMDGHSLHERLRLERPGIYHVVFLSQHAGEADQLRALHGGALDYLTKPVSLRVLMAKLAVWRERTRPT